MAKFCQNCKKTYTDDSATFCEDCGGDLVPLEGAPQQYAAPVHGDEFFDAPPVPLWKKYLPYGIGLVVLAICAAIVPGLIADNVRDNLTVSPALMRLPQSLLGPQLKIPVDVRNRSMFSLHLQSVDITGAIRGVSVASTCADAKELNVDIPKGAIPTPVDLPLCMDKVNLVASLLNQGGGDGGNSSVNGTVVFKVLGMTITKQFQTTLDDDPIRAALNLKDKDHKLPLVDPSVDPRPKIKRSVSGSVVVCGEGPFHKGDPCFGQEGHSIPNPRDINDGGIIKNLKKAAGEQYRKLGSGDKQ